MLDAIVLSMNEMRKAHNPRKALVIISDGGDNSSRYTVSEVKNRVREADVQIYAIGIYESAGGRNRTPEETSGPALLTEIAEQTGGRQYQVDNLNELPDVAAKIGDAAQPICVRYAPSTVRKRRRITRATEARSQRLALLRAYWRLGYYAPAQWLDVIRLWCRRSRFLEKLTLTEIEWIRP